MKKIKSIVPFEYNQSERSIAFDINIINEFRNNNINIGEVFEVDGIVKRINEDGGSTEYTNICRLMIAEDDGEYVILKQEYFGYYSFEFREKLRFDKNKNEIIKKYGVTLGGVYKDESTVNMIYQLGFTSKEEEVFKEKVRLKSKLRELVNNYRLSSDYMLHLCLEGKRQTWGMEVNGILKEDFTYKKYEEIEDYIFEHRENIEEVFREYLFFSDIIDISDFIEEKVDYEIEKKFINVLIDEKRITTENIDEVEEILKERFHPITSELIELIYNIYKKYEVLTNNNLIYSYLRERKINIRKANKLFELILDKVDNIKSLRIEGKENHKFKVEDIIRSTEYFNFEELYKIAEIIHKSRYDEEDVKSKIKIRFREASSYSRYYDYEDSKVEVNYKDFESLRRFRYRGKQYFDIEEIQKELLKFEEI